MLTEIAAFGQSKISWRPTGSALVQPPVLARAARRVAEASQDETFLREIVGPVARYYHWLAQNRDQDKDALVSVISPYETGMDQSPAFDGVLGMRRNASGLELHVRDRILDLQNLVLGNNYELPAIFRHDFFNVEDLMFNCVYAQGLWDVSWLWAQAGDEKQATAFTDMARRTEAAILSKCYDAKARVFWSLGTRAEMPLKVLTAANLFPVILQTIDAPRLDELVGLIMKEEAFWLPYPIPSVANSEPAFRPGSQLAIWRGPTWTNMNWFIVGGLRRHGFHEQADHIAARTADLVMKSGFREYYNPLTGEGYGAKDFGWSTLVVDMS